MIIGDGIVLGAGGESASIFVTGLSQSDTVTATKDGKTINGKWITSSESGKFTAGHPEYIVSAADYLLYTYSSRNYKKAYAGDAYACTVVVNGWLSSLLVSKTANAVSIYTDGNHSSGILKSELTVTYLGETWYVSSSGAAYQATAPATSNVAHFGTFATREEAALAFLKNVAPQPMDGFEISPIKSYGTWHITATNGTKTATSDVVVDSASEYTVELFYGLKLYWDGDECIDVTGSWGITGYSRDTATYPNGLIAATKNADNMFIGANAQYCLTAIGTLNAVDLTNYSNLCVTRLSDNLSQPWIGACQNKNFNEYAVRSSPQVANEEETTIVDISETTGSHYIVFVNSTDSRSISGYVYKIWLE